MPTTVSHQTVRLSRGKHASPESGACVMELTSMLGGEGFTDRPECVCPVIAAFLRAYNDLVDDDRRQDLYPYAAAVVGTRSTPEVEARRGRRCVDLATRLYDEQPRLRRWLTRRPALGPTLRPLALEQVGVQLARALRREGDATHRRALALVDELIAMTPGNMTIEPIGEVHPQRPALPATPV